MPGEECARLNDYQQSLPAGPATQQQYLEKPAAFLSLALGTERCSTVSW